MKQVFVGMSAFAVCLFAIGCQSSPSVVGTWSTNVNGQPATVTFNADQTLVGSVPVQSITVNTVGTYKMEGDQLTITLKADSVDGSGVPESMKAAIISAANQQMQPVSGKMEWSGSNSFTVTPEGQQPLTFTKQ
jgi:hypothetical protein